MSVLGNLNPPTGRSPPQLPNNETKTPPDRSRINTRRRDGRFDRGRLYPPSTPTVLPHPPGSRAMGQLSPTLGNQWPMCLVAQAARSLGPALDRARPPTSPLPPPTARRPQPSSSRHLQPGSSSTQQTRRTLPTRPVLHPERDASTGRFQTGLYSCHSNSCESPTVRDEPVPVGTVFESSSIAYNLARPSSQHGAYHAHVGLAGRQKPLQRRSQRRVRRRTSSRHPPGRSRRRGSGRRRLRAAPPGEKSRRARLHPAPPVHPQGRTG